MHIAVIAASGRLGKSFVEQALAAGHTVRAGVRARNNLTTHPNLVMVPCDATNPTDIKNLLRGQDVVVSCIGHVRGSASDVQTVATKVLVQAMDELKLKRFVTVTGTGVRFPGDKIGLVDRVLNLAISIIDPDRISDGRQHAVVLQQSNLDWTLIRLLKLQNIAAHDFELLSSGPTKWYVGRDEVAQAMLQVIDQNSFVKQSPIISKKRKERNE